MPTAKSTTSPLTLLLGLLDPWFFLLLSFSHIPPALITLLYLALCSERPLSALLSLSNAAAASPPIPLSTSLSSDTPSTQQQLQGKSTPIPITSPTMSKKDVMTQGGNSKQGALKHRRLSSTGQARRRMSDARDAAASVGLRPGYVHVPFSSFSFFHCRFLLRLCLSLPPNFLFFDAYFCPFG